jgi:hypothetical protein
MTITIDITLRDYFAAHALASVGDYHVTVDELATYAYEVADIMLERRKDTSNTESVSHETPDSRD